MNFTYLLGVLLFFPIWIFLYINRKDLRKEMIFMGSLIMVGALFMEAFVWTRDWWHPKTLTSTIIGIEDALFGFLAGGIIVSIYEELFKEKLVAMRGRRKDHHVRNFILVIILSACIGNITFFYMHMHSYYATLWAMLIPVCVIYFLRKDLITLSLGSGAIITVVSIPIYCIIFFYDPTAINSWSQENISGIMPLGIPIEDLVWFFVTGMFLAPLYEFWKGERLKHY